MNTKFKHGGHQVEIRQDEPPSYDHLIFIDGESRGRESSWYQAEKSAKQLIDAEEIK